ncbi:MAG: alpha/beta fold hydrolase [Oscillospiraceae bacterium]
MNIAITQIEFKSYSKLAMISCAVMVPKGEIKGVVQIAHGMYQSMDDYKRVMYFLCENGFVVAGNDHIGHGKSKTIQKVGIFFGRQDGHKVLVNDVYKLSHILQNKYPDVPHILLGHSMGSFVSRLVASTYAGCVDGLILSGTAGTTKGVKSGIHIASVIGKVKGKTYYSRALAKLSDGSFNQYFRRNKLDAGYGNSWLTRDEQFLEARKNQGGYTVPFTTQAYHDLYVLCSLANKPQWYQSLSKKMPILLLSGTHDPVGDFGKGVSEVYRKLEKAGVDSVTLKLYPEGRHEMLNEINYKQVHQDILDWILKNFCK